MDFQKGELVQVCRFDTRNGVKVWCKAKIKDIRMDGILIKYTERVSVDEKLVEWIPGERIIETIRRVEDKKSNHLSTLDDAEASAIVSTPMRTSENKSISQFREGDIVQYKIEDTDMWTAAEVRHAGPNGGYIKIEYKHDDKHKVTVRVHQSQLEKKIKFVGDESKLETDTHPQDTPAQDTPAQDTPAQDAPLQNTHQNLGESNVNINKNTSSGDNVLKQGWDYVKQGWDYVSGGGADKKKRTYKEKAIKNWTHKDVIDWIKSFKGASKYCPENFPQHINGHALLEIKKEDLTLIIAKKMRRGMFMDKLEIAKDKYAKAPELNEDEYENDDDGDTIMDDEKINEKVNGFVGLSNLGNTCYMNTSIQILSQSPDITRYLSNRAKLKLNNNKTNGHYPMLNAWTKLCDVIYNQPKPKGYKYRVETPKNIRSALSKIDPEFASGHQDDSSRSLGYMLQGLDEEIDLEIKHQKKSKTDITSKCNISIQPRGPLSEKEIDNYVNTLLIQHNPTESILKRTFDGIEHITCQCLECNNIFHQFSTFRILDLQVIGHEIILSNINVICNNKVYILPDITVLNYCSVDIIKYYSIKHVLDESLEEKKNEQIINYKADTILISQNGDITQINDGRFSDLKKKSGSIFVLISNKKNNATSRLLQLNVSIDAASKTNVKLVKYNKFNPTKVGKLIINESKRKLNNIDDEKEDYYAIYNGNAFSKTELKKKDFQKDKNIHHFGGVNLLVILSVNVQAEDYRYDYDKVNEFLVYEAQERHPSSSIVDALKKEKSFWENKTAKIFEEQIKTKLVDIKRAMHVFNTKQKITKKMNDLIYDNFKFGVITSGSNPTKLQTLEQCLEQYERAQILDPASYAHPCPCKVDQGDSKWVKFQKKIVYSPPIFLFHFDRYGKNMIDNHTTTKSKLYSYHKGQNVAVKWWKNGKFYQAKIVNIESNRMLIRYSDGDEEWISEKDYSYKIKTSSNSSSRGNNYYNYNNNYRESTKFEHGINYKLQLKWDKRYSLYGVSNHGGSATFGHYSASIKCLTDGKWYNISDSTVRKADNPLQHSKEATILAYSRVTN